MPSKKHTEQQADSTPDDNAATSEPAASIDTDDTPTRKQPLVYVHWQGAPSEFLSGPAGGILQPCGEAPLAHMPKDQAEAQVAEHPRYFAIIKAPKPDEPAE